LIKVIQVSRRPSINNKYNTNGASAWAGNSRNNLATALVCFAAPLDDKDNFLC